MDNLSKISAKFAGLRREVNTACFNTLVEVMPAVLEESLELHESLEGRHEMHLEAGDSHGYAVAHSNGLIDSGANVGDGTLRTATTGRSAQRAAEAEALDNGGEYKGTFIATMDFGFLSVDFESGVQEILRRNVEKTLPGKFKTQALAAK